MSLTKLVSTPVCIVYFNGYQKGTFVIIKYWTKDTTGENRLSEIILF